MGETHSTGSHSTGSHSTGSHSIRIVGAREHNLKDVTLDIPKNTLTVFTGVSGSGKSSLVFDTLAVEAQRQLNATFGWYIRNQLPKYERPDADAIDHLSTPVVVDQKPVGGNSRSTVGTMTDVHSMIRALFARHGTPSEGLVSRFSFNDPKGMCPECEGLGQVRRIDPDRVVDRTKSLDEGAILVPWYRVGSPEWQLYATSGRLDPAKPLAQYTPDEWHTLLHGSGGPKVKVSTKNSSLQLNYEGLVDRVTRLNVKRDVSTMSEKNQAAVAAFLVEQLCPACDGARLNPAALATRIDGRSIADWARMEIGDLIGVLARIDDPAAAPLAGAARTALERIAEIGLGYLSLDRATGTLSGGEGQRLKLVRHLGSTLTGMTYFFDEPSTGLHPRDVGRVGSLLRALRDQGNTVLVVEHDPDVIALADHVVDVGPGAGVNGGEIVFRGTYEELRAADTLTGRGLRAAAVARTRFREPRGKLPVENAALHNLKDVSVVFPTGVLTVVTGVAGSGKSSLASGAFMERYPDAVYVDQSPIAASSRSTPATYLGLMDPLRKLFAKANGVAPGLFSANSAGACEDCQGRGAVITEVAYMDPVTTHCETCDGRRFKESVLAHRLRGKSVADVLEMSAREAAGYFEERALREKATALVDVGLGYLSLGQSLSTLSGGERQRIKLAVQLNRSGSVYVLDEPTTGLHMSDVATLVTLLDRLVDRGNTVIVVEHNLDVVKEADWIIDLGPDGGKGGGEIVFTGTPSELLAVHGSLTGEHLRRHLGVAPA
ncbi:ATP-binding cassette domain-containing protein [Streptomyces candidus]|uniref:UvrABC system protein A n=1 Tax=Streptomyces candidus TaxID=67283 RepID=A0A7X0LQ56_9ACTN|nr:excinuclease ABC subunit UvrA [Streptomyces candidus]MBB6436680.1 excinuclease UvrABC ATPase subunit [Streptomyces candidus]GHH51039.1 thiamine ABC transporter permease [Streptomyces candidus]